jgi:hypothetical protein
MRCRAAVARPGRPFSHEWRIISVRRAPEFATGASSSIAGAQPKISGPALAAARRSAAAVRHAGRWRSISQTTEFSSVYQAAEIAAIALRQKAGIAFHMDAPTNAVAAVAPPADHWRAGSM